MVPPPQLSTWFMYDPLQKRNALNRSFINYTREVVPLQSEPLHDQSLDSILMHYFMKRAMSHMLYCIL